MHSLSPACPGSLPACQEVSPGLEEASPISEAGLPQGDGPLTDRRSATTRRVLAAGPLAARLSLVLGLAASAATLAGCLGYDGDVIHGYQLDAQAAADVKPGQSAEQVLVTLGTPSTTSTVGGNAWYYISHKTDRSIAFMKPTVTDRKIYAVYFDKGKKVERTANYGLQDGKIIDFATGATPTFGADQNFLKGLFFNFNPLQSFMGKS